MSEQPVVLYEAADGVARLTLNRPERGNAITPRLIAELVECVRRADLDPAVHVLLLAGAGSGFCGGYDLLESAEGMGAGAEGMAAGAKGLRRGAEGPRTGAEGTGPAAGAGEGSERSGAERAAPPGSPLDPAVMAANHDPRGTWDPMVDYAMMSRNAQGFMSLFNSGKPVICKVHGFCVAGGTDMALCSDLLVIADDAKIGYPPARVWGSPTTSLWAHRIGAQRAKRLLFTGDSLSGAEALEWGLAIEAPPADRLDERAEALAARIARMPVNQLMMMKLLVNQTLYSQGLHASQVLGTVFDGIARHTAEGYAFQRHAAEHGYREAVRERDEPFGDAGRSTFKG
jgi:enoyl-CoA hydratase